MPDSEDNKYRLNFVVQKGIAEGWRVTLTHQCLQWHIDEHGNDRPELLDDDFIDIDIIETFKNPHRVYPRVTKNRSGAIKLDNRQLVFYGKKLDERYTMRGNKIYYYVKVVAGINKDLEIITALKSDKINEENLCKPLTKI